MRAGVANDHLPIHRHAVAEFDAIPVELSELGSGEVVAHLCPVCWERIRSWQTPIMAIDSPSAGQLTHGAWLDDEGT